MRRPLIREALGGTDTGSTNMELILRILGLFAIALAVVLGGPLLRRSWRQGAGWSSLELIGPFAAFALWFPPAQNAAR